MNKRQIFFYRLFLIITLSSITYIAVTDIEHAVIESMWDKSNHLIAFLVLAFLADFSFPGASYGSSKIAPLLLYGILIEIIQIYIPSRNCSVYDVVADAVGLIMYAFTIPLIKKMPVFKKRWEKIPAEDILTR